jgi:hypothetical protein
VNRQSKYPVTKEKSKITGEIAGSRGTSRLCQHDVSITPIRRIQMARFDGKSWVLFGEK